MKIKVDQVVSYHSHSVSASGVVKLTLKAMYSELTRTIELNQLLNNDVYVRAKIPGQSGTLNLGYFMINGLSTNSDGCSTIKLNGMSNCVELDNLNFLPMKHDEEALFRVRYEAEIESEEE